MKRAQVDTGLLVEEHSDYLLTFAMSKLSDIDLSKDLVQDTFLSAIIKIDTFENRSNIRTWLTSILNRKIIDHWRRAETRYTDPISSFFDQDDSSKHWILDKKDNATNETVEDKIIFEETNDDLFECIGKLPEKWKGVIASKYLDEKVSEDICKELEITPSNLWVIIHRAKLLLRDCLRKRDVR